MNLAITQLHPLFVAEVRGADLARDIDLPMQQAIEGAMDEYAVCVLPDQGLDDEAQIAFSRRYGPLENASAVKAQRKAGVMGTRIRHPEIFDVSNLDENGDVLPAADERWRYRLANELWHSDSSFRQRASTWSLLHARIVPPAQHPLVRRHPGSGRKALFIASHASHIVGWPREAGRALLDELMAFATQPRFVYAHKWRAGDLVIWDNRCTLHRASPFASDAHKRELHRTTIIDTRGDLAAGLH